MEIKTLLLTVLEKPQEEEKVHNAFMILRHLRQPRERGGSEIICMQTMCMLSARVQAQDAIFGIYRKSHMPCTGTRQYTWNILISQHLMVLILR